MAVFTQLELVEVNDWLKNYPQIHQAISLVGIASGIENSNFFVDLQTSGKVEHYVLTIFERLNESELPFYLLLMEHLAQKGIPVPAPLKNNRGILFTPLKNKPATLVTKLAGRSHLEPGELECQQVGAMMAKMHLAGQDFAHQQKNLRSLDWWKETIPSILNYLNTEQKILIEDELNAQINFFGSANYACLPEGPSHCDLFRDNVLFVGSEKAPELSGFFDFYFAGTDKWLFDLAVTINDWCIDRHSGELDLPRYQALLNSYQSVRPLTAVEQASWPLMLRAAALRFWVSRLWDFYLPRDAKLLKPHDPRHFERVLLARRNFSA